MKTIATYHTREGQRWELGDLRAHPFAPGFWWARRFGDQRLVCVHEHRMTFHELPQESALVETPGSPAPADTTNPS